MSSAHYQTSTHETLSDGNSSLNSASEWKAESSNADGTSTRKSAGVNHNPARGAGFTTLSPAGTERYRDDPTKPSDSGSGAGLSGRPFIQLPSSNHGDMRYTDTPGGSSRAPDHQFDVEESDGSAEAGCVVGCLKFVTESLKKAG